MESRGVEARKPNAQIRASRTMSREDLRKRKVLQVVSLANIKVMEELFVNHGEKVMLLKRNNTCFVEESRMKSES